MTQIRSKYAKEAENGPDQAKIPEKAGNGPNSAKMASNRLKMAKIRPQ